MFDKYFLCLYSQYCDSNGIEFRLSDFNASNKGFIEWVAKNNNIMKEYQEYLRNLGCINGSQIVEINKGVYDSFGGDIEVVSFFGETFDRENQSFLIVGGVPLIAPNESFEVLDANMILTHNPYSITSVSDWYKVHNLGMCDISVGVYGKVYDLDASEKMKIIEDLRKRMNDDFVVNFDTSRDNYFYNITSKRKIKIKELVK